MKLVIRYLRWVPILAISLSPLVAQSNLPPGSVDGAVHPELIPDVVALRLFLGALHDPSTAISSVSASSSSLQPSPKQRAKLLPAGLNATDTNVLLQTLQTWHSKITAVGSPAASINLDDITQGTLGILQESMSPAGFASLLAHVRAEKKHMKTVPVPDNPQHNH